MCLTAVLSWGGMFPLMGTALKILDPFNFTLLRFIPVAIIFILLLIKVEGKEKLSTEGQTGKLWALGTLGFAAFNFLVFLGQQKAGPSGAIIAAVLSSLQPLLGVAVNWVAKKVTPKPFTILFMVVSLIGSVMVVTRGDLSVFVSKEGDLFADFLILVGSLGFVIYALGGSSFPEWSPLRYTAVTTMYGTVSMIVIVGLASMVGLLRFPDFSMIIGVSGTLLYMIFISGVLAHLAWTAGSRIIAPINGILFQNMVPVTTIMISVTQGYHLSTLELIGASITIVGLIGNNLYVRGLSQQRLQQPNMQGGYEGQCPNNIVESK